jgi:hypothetical protein
VLVGGSFTYVNESGGYFDYVVDDSDEDNDDAVSVQSDSTDDSDIRVGNGTASNHRHRDGMLSASTSREPFWYTPGPLML